jgi:hypothetical protein
VPIDLIVRSALPPAPCSNQTLMLGRASAAMTLDAYAALSGDDLDTVADQLDVTGRAAAADQLAAAAREAAADQVRTDDPEEDDGSTGR